MFWIPDPPADRGNSRLRCFGMRRSGVACPPISVCVAYRSGKKAYVWYGPYRVLVKFNFEYRKLVAAGQLMTKPRSSINAVEHDIGGPPSILQILINITSACVSRKQSCSSYQKPNRSFSNLVLVIMNLLLVACAPTALPVRSPHFGRESVM